MCLRWGFGAQQSRRPESAADERADFRKRPNPNIWPDRLRSSLSSMTNRVSRVKFPKMNAVDNPIQPWLRTASCCALFILASTLSGAMAQSRPPDAGAANSRISFLSEPREDAKRPDEQIPRSDSQQDNSNFDGAWTFTSAGCPYTGSLPATITGGKILIRGGSGQVDPDGTLHSVGAGNGMTLTAVGQLSGNTGSGTFNRSDGCVGNWIAIKRSRLRGRRP
jgi:hypothetical protein